MSLYDDQVEALIRDGIYDHVTTAVPPVFVDWLECDGLDPVGSPLTVREPLTEEQDALHKTAVTALLAFLESLPVTPAAIDAKRDEIRSDQAAREYDDWRARHKNGDRS